MVLLLQFAQNNRVDIALGFEGAARGDPDQQKSSDINHRHHQWKLDESPDDELGHADAPLTGNGLRVRRESLRTSASAAD